MAPTLDDPVQHPRDWWRQAVVYQIYPRSFAAVNGGGMGDLAGITTRVGYLQALGVDAVWLSPFYPSALADGGYDVDDYRDVDPRLGTLDDFDALVAALHGAGIKVIVDIVPNHSSNRHAWFREALAAGPGAPARERYLFRNGTGPDGGSPPNDWQNGFGGPAWTRVTEPDGTPGQWYFHLYTPQQPDFNWEHPEVRADFERTLRFWSDRGVDGFRIDVAHGLAKDLSEPFAAWSDVPGTAQSAEGSHPLWDRDEVHDIYAAWRRVFDEYDPPRFAVAEAHAHPSRRARYAAATGLGQVFNFALQDADWEPTGFRRIIDDALAVARESGSTTTWHLENHDVPRVATRYGLPRDPEGTAMIDVARAWLLTNGERPALDCALGERRARAAALLLLALPGCTYLYQGQELGLHEVAELRADELQDPIAVRSGGAAKGRDGCRVPLPWSPDGPSLGFGPGPARPPQPPWFAAYAASRQAGHPRSTLSLMRRAIAVRRELAVDEAFAWSDAGAGVLDFRRSGRWRCVTNFGPDPVALPDGELVVSSEPLDGRTVPPDVTAWVA